MFENPESNTISSIVFLVVSNKSFAMCKRHSLIRPVGLSSPISVCQVIERKEVLKNYFSSPISSFEKSDGKLTHKESKKFLQSVLKIINDNITNKD